MKKNAPANALKDREAQCLSYLLWKLEKSKRIYVNTNYNYLKNILKYKTTRAVRYLLKAMQSKKYISVLSLENYNRRPYLRIEIARPRVVKRLLAEYKAQRSGSTDQNEIKKENVNKTLKTEDSIHNINNINIYQTSHNEDVEFQSRTTTIVQDMLEVYNKTVGGTVSSTKELSCWLVAAFQQKFKTIERWKEYVKRKVWGKVKDTFHFLRYILKFAIINATMGEMGMSAELPKDEATQKKGTLEEISAISDETPDCIYAREQFVKNLGVAKYNSWISVIKLRCSEDPQTGKRKIKIETSNNFVRDWVQNNFLDRLEQYLNCFWKEREKLQKMENKRAE